jgi:ABC-type glycerol-3-phosphate transport system substrate-binding protein
MKKIKFIIALLLGTFGLTSCSPPLWFMDSEDTTDYSDREQLIFDHLWQRGDDYYTSINNLITEFNESDIAEELNVYVKGNGINFWDYWDKVNLSISGGTSPDIYLHCISSVPSRLNYLLNLDSMYDYDVENGVETLNSRDMFFDSQIEDISKYSDGDMYAWPFSSTIRVVYYNKDLFEANGIDELPTTWAEMEEVSEKLTTYKTEGEEESGYQIVGYDPFSGDGSYMHQWGWLEGNSFWSYDEETGEAIPNFNNDELIENIGILYNSYCRRDDEARELLEDFMNEFSMSGENVFGSGRLGMILGNEGLNATLIEANVDFDYGVFELPTFSEDIQTSNWSSSYSIELYDNSNRDITDEVAEQRNRGSWEFLKSLYSEEAQGIFSECGFMLSDQTYYDEYIYTSEIKTALSKAISNTREAEYIYAAPSWPSDIQTYVNSIYSYDMTIEEAMDKVQALMESKVEQYYTVNSI